MTERCSCCSKIILTPTDEPTKAEHEQFKKDGLCTACRGNPERQEFFKAISPEAQQTREAAERCHTTPENLDEFIEFTKNPELRNLILEDLSRTIKHDDTVKMALFHTYLSSCLDPINLSIKAESGAGKTYNATKVAEYFPKEKIWMLGGVSAKALIHQKGVLKDKDGVEIPLDDIQLTKPKLRDYTDENAYNLASDDYNKKRLLLKTIMENSYTEIDLTGIVLLFLEAPSIEAFEMLKPILSHDEKMIEYRFVDKNSKGQMLTKKVRIKGWPSAVFCSVDKLFLTEFATRTFTTTPETSQDKIKDAIGLINHKQSYPFQYQTESITKQLTKSLIRCIQDLFTTPIETSVNSPIIEVINPFPNLHELFPREIARDMRDYEHFSQFLKTFTLLKVYQRPILSFDRLNFYIITTLEDVLEALEVFREMFETTRANTDKKILDFYKAIIQPLGKDETISIKEATAKYNNLETTKRKLSDYTIRYWLERLNKIGYVDKDKIDNKAVSFSPLITDENNCENVCISPIQTKTIDLLKTGFKSWLKTMLQEYALLPIYKISCVSMGLNGWGNQSYNLTANVDNEGKELEKNVLYLNRHFCKILNTPFEDLETVIDIENVCDDEIKPFSQPNVLCADCGMTIGSLEEFYWDSSTDNTVICKACYDKKLAEAPDKKLKVVTEDSGLRRLEVNQDFKKSALEEIHYHRIPPNEPHKCQCPSCSGEGVREADFETVDSEGKPLFVCEGCLKALEPKVKASGMVLVEDLPDYDEREAS